MVSLNALHDHRLRWNRVAARIFDMLPFLGIEERDVRITGDPYVLQVGCWASLSLVETESGPAILLRTDKPPGLTCSIDAVASDDVVVHDAVECLQAAMRRRRRHLDDEQQAKEAELFEMIQGIGLTAVDIGVTPLKADFTSAEGTLRGSLERIESRSDRPDQARFAVTMQLAPMAYAEALRAIQLARDLAARWSGSGTVLKMDPPQEAGAACIT